LYKTLKAFCHHKKADLNRDFSTRNCQQHHNQALLLFVSSSHLTQRSDSLTTAQEIALKKIMFSGQILNHSSRICTESLTHVSFFKDLGFGIFLQSLESITSRGSGEYYY
jgi:hypothetical protein